MKMKIGNRMHWQDLNEELVEIMIRKRKWERKTKKRTVLETRYFTIRYNKDEIPDVQIIYDKFIKLVETDLPVEKKKGFLGRVRKNGKR